MKLLKETPFMVEMLFAPPYDATLEKMISYFLPLMIHFCYAFKFKCRLHHSIPVCLLCKRGNAYQWKKILKYRKTVSRLKCNVYFSFIKTVIKII